MAKKDEDERVLGTGATGDVEHPELVHGNEGTPADGVPVDHTNDVPDKTPAEEEK